MKQNDQDGNFHKKPPLAPLTKYNRKAGGVDGDDSGNDTYTKNIGAALDDAGFQMNGYQTKKGTPFQMGSSIDYVETRPLNRLPPGMFIDNQDVCDIRTIPYKEIVAAAGYPNDGWQMSTTEAVSDANQRWGLKTNTGKTRRSDT